MDDISSINSSTISISSCSTDSELLDNLQLKKRKSEKELQEISSEANKEQQVWSDYGSHDVSKGSLESVSSESHDEDNNKLFIDEEATFFDLENDIGDILRDGSPVNSPVEVAMKRKLENELPKISSEADEEQVKEQQIRSEYGSHDVSLNVSQGSLDMSLETVSSESHDEDSNNKLFIDDEATFLDQENVKGDGLTVEITMKRKLTPEPTEEVPKKQHCPSKDPKEIIEERCAIKTAISKIVIQELNPFYKNNKFKSKDPIALFKAMAKYITHHYFDNDPHRPPQLETVKDHILEIFYNKGYIETFKDFQ